MSPKLLHHSWNARLVPCHGLFFFSCCTKASHAGSSFPLANASKWYQEKTGLSPIFCSLLMLKVRCLRLQWMAIFLLLFVVFKRAANLSFYSCNAFIFGVASAFRLIARCVWEKVCRFYLFIKVYVISLSLSQISLVCKILRSVNLFFVKLCSLFTQHHHMCISTNKSKTTGLRYKFFSALQTRVFVRF